MMAGSYILFLLLLGVLYVEAARIDACESLKKSSNSNPRFLRTIRDIALELRRDPRCPKDFGLYKDPSDCHKYVVCLDGKAIVEECPEGQVFDDISGCNEGVCNGQEFHTEESICDLPADTGPCRANFEMYYYDRASKSCKTFVYGGCDGNANKFPDEDTCQRSCLFNARDDASDSITCEKDGKYPDPNSCDRYIGCANGMKYDIPCQNGMHYSKDKETCEAPCEAHCDQSLACECGWSTCTVTSETATTEIPETFTTTTPGVQANCSGNELRSHSSDCNKFIQCHETVANEMRCPSGLHFSKKAERCLYPCDANCDADIDCELDGNYCRPGTCFRCPQVGKYADPFDCSIYIECNHNIPRIKQCKAGKYFDRRSRNCVPETKVKCKHQCTNSDGLCVYPRDCERYVECRNSISRVKKCPGGQAFDPKKLHCVSASETDCSKYDVNDLMDVLNEDEDVWE